VGGAFIAVKIGSISVHRARPITTPQPSAKTIPKLARLAALAKSPSPSARATTELIPTITPTPSDVLATATGKMKETAASASLPSLPMK
jgi:hypothetical protein